MINIENPTGHVRVRYINEDSFTNNSFNNKYYFDYFTIPKYHIVMNNEAKPNKNCINKMSRKRSKIRNKEEFILELQKLSKINRGFLNYNYLRKIKRNDLLWESQKHFGGWRKAVEHAGFRPIQKGWTKQEVIDCILKIYQKTGKIPKSKEVIKLGYPGLNKAANRRFGNWTNALVESGLKPFRKNWSRKRVIEELKEISKEIGHSPSMRELKELGKYDLLNAGLKYFSKYNDFLNAANLPIVLEMNKWPKKRIIQELLKVAEKLGRTPRRTELAAMCKYDLINAAERHFPTWSDALIAAKLIPNPDVLNNDRTWREFENLIIDIIKKEKKDLITHKYIKNVGYPDIYIPSEKKIIEIKINCSDNSVKKDIDKYLPFCNKLEIWYFFGKPFGILSNKVSFIGPNRIFEMIKDNVHLLSKYKKIKQEANNVSKKPKKVLVLGSGAH